MATAVTVSIPHQLGRAEARRRIESGFGGILQQITAGGGALTQQWEGDRLRFGIATLGQRISGVVDVLDASVTIEIELPGVLGVIANALRGRLQRAGEKLLLPRK
jgi:Putative polyhydroxyalkanoic acid system protein (PHA_gran_rgn)